MLPTLNARGDVVLLFPGPVRAGALRLGDIVVARSPVNPRHTVCKRVAGLPGGRVDPWAAAAGLGGGGRHAARAPPITSSSASTSIPIPAGHVWLQGDNAANSTDSRAYGPVPLALVRGVVVWRVWPPGRAGRVDGGPGAAWAAQVYRAPRAGEEAGGQAHASGGRPRY